MTKTKKQKVYTYAASDLLAVEVHPGSHVRITGTRVTGWEDNGRRAVRCARFSNDAIHNWLYRLPEDADDELARIVMDCTDGEVFGVLCDWCYDHDAPEIDIGFDWRRHLTTFARQDAVYEDVDRTFRVGDQAEYGSYNISYFSAIVKIGPKTVTIGNKYGDGSQHRLTAEGFARRNANWFLEKAQADNWAYQD